jgi:SAM-dependent methyltransferase
MTLAFSSEETSPFVRALLADQGIPPGGVRLDVDDRDEMLEFLVRVYEGDRERALFSYFRTGQSVADSMLQVIRWRFGTPDKVGRLLDFASGYGRVTRFLLREIPADRLWVSDIYEGGVRFQEERLGVHGLVSTILPEDFTCETDFDVILVTSLFTHLPEERFVGWLRTLTGLLRPGGMLLFSVHDQAVLEPVHGQMPAEGILFKPISESRSLDTQDYGSTWVTEAFVRAAIERAADVPVSVHRIPRGICNYQDLYAVICEEGVDFSSLAFQTEPYLLTDHCDLAAPDVLELRGWAAAYQGGVKEVQVSIDGRVAASAPVDGPRPDVAAYVGERFGRSGWSCACPLPAGTTRNGSVLILRVVDGRGVGYPIWASTIETLRLACTRAEVVSLRNAWQHAEARLAEAEARSAAEISRLNARIAAMEASRFWKMRNAWFALKRALGLTRET